VYADISQLPHAASADSTALSMALLRDAHVALVPGDDFGFAAPKRHVRLSYATAYARIEEAVERMARVLRG
jgi:aspartate/methionine/tyrosine aminotransferase